MWPWQSPLPPIEEPVKWKLLQLTLVHYPTGDGPIGKLMAYITLLPLFIWTSLLSLSLQNRQALSIAAGLSLNELLNWRLKMWIGNSRPQKPDDILNGCLNGYVTSGTFGMPSSHAQFMAFFYLTMVKLFLSSKSKSALFKRNHTMRYLMNSFILVVTLAVCWSRIYLQYHTVEQVLAGFTIGLLSAQLYLKTLSPLVSHLLFDIMRSAVQSQCY